MLAGVLRRPIELLGVEDQRVVHLAGNAGQDAEVAGPEHQDVDAVEGGDLLGVFEGAGLFDLNREERLAVGLLE